MKGLLIVLRRKKELKINAKNLDGIISPLDPGMILTDLLVDKIRSLDSAKKPIMMEWRNGGLLFKAEDDLRQDVLGIQIVETLDTSWKSRSAFESKYRYDYTHISSIYVCKSFGP